MVGTACQLAAKPIGPSSIIPAPSVASEMCWYVVFLVFKKLLLLCIGIVFPRPI